jgi:predicted Rossmann-fold nucleotide-binding protein
MNLFSRWIHQMTYKVLVCGGRDYQNETRVFKVLDRILTRYGPLLIIEGGARGADSLARKWAQARNQNVRTFPADWDKYKKGAGFRRNTQMLKEGQPDLVVAFPGGTGTAMMVTIAKEATPPIRVIEIKDI